MNTAARITLALALAVAVQAQTSVTGGTAVTSGPWTDNGSTVSTTRNVNVGNRVLEYAGKTVDVKALGAKADGVHADNAAILAAIAGSNHVYFSPGNYLVDNSGGHLVIDSFTGWVQFATGAKITFNTLSHGGLYFTNAVSARLSGLRLGWSGTPSVRVDSDAALNVVTSSDVVVENTQVDNAPGMGIFASRSSRVTINNATVHDTLADGISGANSTDVLIANATVYNTGDDAVACDSYTGTGYAQGDGFVATGLMLTNVATGISNFGCKNFTASNFIINGTEYNGISINHTTSVSGSWYPDNIVVANGVVQGVGSIAGYSYPAGISVYSQGNSGTINANFQNVAITGSAYAGVLSGIGYTAPATNINLTLDGISVTGVTGANGGFFLSAGTIRASNLSVSNSTGPCFAFKSSGFVFASTLRAYDCAKANGNNRAVWLYNVANSFINGLLIVDDQASATGYVLEDYGSTSGQIIGIQTAITNGSLTVYNNDAGVGWATNTVYRCLTTDSSHLAVGALTITAASCLTSKALFTRVD